jgi:hypothetical protein
MELHFHVFLTSTQDGDERSTSRPGQLMSDERAACTHSMRLRGPHSQSGSIFKSIVTGRRVQSSVVDYLFTYDELFSCVV